MNKITNIWFDEALGDFQRQEIPYESIFLTPEELAAAAELDGSITTTMRLTREELAERFGVDIKANAPATPEIWYTGGRQVGKQLTLENLKRMSDELTRNIKPEPYYLTADLYDRMQAEGMALGGVTRMPKPPRYSVRPPAAAKSRAALHPLVGRLIDNLNKEN